MSTKIHAVVDALGNPTALHLTGGEVHDLAGAGVDTTDGIFRRPRWGNGPIAPGGVPPFFSRVYCR